MELGASGGCPAEDTSTRVVSRQLTPSLPTQSQRQLQATSLQHLFAHLLGRTLQTRNREEICPVHELLSQEARSTAQSIPESLGFGSICTVHVSLRLSLHSLPNSRLPCGASTWISRQLLLSYNTYQGSHREQWQQSSGRGL